MSVVASAFSLGRGVRGFAPHPGTLVASFLAALFLGAIASLLANAGRASFGDVASPYLARVVTGSIAQAAFSTILSLALGATIALAVARRRGFVARACRALLLTAAVAPTIVVVLGVVAVYGRAGWAASALGALGWPSIYGLAGILIAHVALNAPYAARVFLHGLGKVPPEHHRIAAMCGLTPWQVFWQCDWPAMKRDAAGLAALIFLLCFTSFAVVLTLGGGPANATLEVAIYEAVRVEVDFGRAGLLALLQIALVGLFMLGAGRFIAAEPVGETSGRMIARADILSLRLRIFDAAILGVAALALAPVLLTPLAGLANVAGLVDSDVARALATSLGVAFPAALLCAALALSLAARSLDAQGRPRGKLFALAPMLALAVPPFALLAGLYGPLRRLGDATTLAFILVPLVNAIVALPFAFRLIEPAMRLSRHRYGRLAAHLNVAGLARLRVIDAPALRRPLLAAFAMALALSMGDFGVAALFGGENFRTLPLLLAERMGAYRMAEAQGVALLMMAIAFLLALATEFLADADDRRS